MERAGSLNFSRRNLLLGRADGAGERHPLRPPWATEASVSAHCTACGDCLTACPEAILFADPDGQPFVDLSDAACTFCGACAEACAADVFAPAGSEGRRSPDAGFAHVVQIESACLMVAGVECRLCADHCDTRALRFDYHIGPAGGIALDPDACTGCGACIAPCPVSAIVFRHGAESGAGANSGAGAHRVSDRHEARP